VYDTAKVWLSLTDRVVEYDCERDEDALPVAVFRLVTVRLRDVDAVNDGDVDHVKVAECVNALVCVSEVDTVLVTAADTDTDADIVSV